MTTTARDAGGPTADAGAGTQAAATIVPLYTWPTDASWTAIVAAKRAHPAVRVIAILNPGNGPGTAANASYVSGIANLIAGGVEPIGYVFTDYARRATATVQADIDRWQALYRVGGIFFDEQSNQAQDVAYYRTLTQYARSKGLPFTVGNPGTDTSEAFIGVFDAMLIYESGGLPSLTALGGWHTKYPTANFGIIPYATGLDTAFVQKARAYVRYIYLNNDQLPNPWDSLPPYFGDLLGALE